MPRARRVGRPASVAGSTNAGVVGESLDLTEDMVRLIPEMEVAMRSARRSVLTLPGNPLVHVTSGVIGLLSEEHSRSELSSADVDWTEVLAGTIHGTAGRSLQRSRVALFVHRLVPGQAKRTLATSGSWRQTLRIGCR